MRWNNIQEVGKDETSFPVYLGKALCHRYEITVKTCGLVSVGVQFAVELAEKNVARGWTTTVSDCRSRISIQRRQSGRRRLTHFRFCSEKDPHPSPCDFESHEQEDAALLLGKPDKAR